MKRYNCNITLHGVLKEAQRIQMDLKTFPVLLFSSITVLSITTQPDFKSDHIFVYIPATPMIPTCEILHTTAPSAWTSSSLTGMSLSSFSSCLELMGQDPFLASYQRSEVFKKVKEVRLIYCIMQSFLQPLKCV